MLYSILMVMSHAKLKRQLCVSVTDWLGYTFFAIPMMELGYCIIDHAGKSVQMSDICEEMLPYIECFNNTI